MASSAARPPAIPTSLWSQFLRNSPRYGAGLVFLALYQYAQYAFDTGLRKAINAALSHQQEQASVYGLLLVGLACAGLAVRVLSRMTIFNAGRNAEYELPALAARSIAGARAVLLPPHEHGRDHEPRHQRPDSGAAIARVRRVERDQHRVRADQRARGSGADLPRADAGGAGSPAALAGGHAQFLAPVLRTNARKPGSARPHERSRTGQRRRRCAWSAASRSRTAEVRAFERENQGYLEKSLRLAYVRGAFGLVLQATVAVGVLVVFWYGGTLVLSNQLDAGGFLAFYRALGRLTWPLISLGFVVSLVQRGRASYSRLEEVFRAEPDIVDGALALERHEGRLSVRSLTFAYWEREVLTTSASSSSPASRWRSSAAPAAASPRWPCSCRDCSPLPAGQRVPRRHRRLRSAAHHRAWSDRLRSAERVSVLDHRRSQHRLPARRSRRARGRGKDSSGGRRGPRARGDRWRYLTASTPSSANAACSSPVGRSSASRWRRPSFPSPAS